MDNAAHRSPAPDSTPDYPTLSAHGEARRRFLKLCALSTAAAALGLELTGCPSSGGGGGTDWVPWDDQVPLAGAVAMVMGQPVAVVVGGGPIAVTFSDGVKKEVVVAGVMTPMQDVDPKADVTAKAAAHAKIVRDAAAKVPSSALADAKALDAFEAEVGAQINQTLGGSYFDEVSAAEAETKKPAASNESARSESRAQAPSAPSAAAPAPASSSEPAASLAPSPSGAPSPTARRSPRAKTLWTPCRRKGCTTCKG